MCYTKILDHFVAPTELQILCKKLYNTNLSYRRTFNILISSLVRIKNYAEFSYENCFIRNRPIKSAICLYNLFN